MTMAWSGESGLGKAAAVFAVVTLVSLAVWGLSVFFMHGDGDTYPGGALGVGAVVGLGGTVVGVGGLLVVCLIGFVRLMMTALVKRGEQ